MTVPTDDDLPSTLQRSPKKARDTWLATHDSAVEQYGEGERAHCDDGDSAGGVDLNASKAHLYDIARRLGVEGRSTMTKAQLAEAVQRANDRATAAARDDGS